MKSRPPPRRWIGPEPDLMDKRVTYPIGPANWNRYRKKKAEMERGPLISFGKESSANKSRSKKSRLFDSDQLENNRRTSASRAYRGTMIPTWKTHFRLRSICKKGQGQDRKKAVKERFIESGVNPHEAYVEGHE